MSELRKEGFRVSIEASALSELIFHPSLIFVACDNKEASTLAGIKSGQTFRPCRVCECTLQDMQLHFSRYGFEDAIRSVDNVVAAMAANDTGYAREHSVHYDLQVSRAIEISAIR